MHTYDIRDSWKGGMEEAPPPPTPEPGGLVSIWCFFQEGDVFSIDGGELRAMKLAKLNHSLHSLCSEHWGAGQIIRGTRRCGTREGARGAMSVTLAVKVERGRTNMGF